MERIVTNKKISVIVPVYNAIETLDRCVRSVLDQTYQNLELLLVDDCSKDGSLACCRAWEKKDERIRVFAHDTNKGPGGARNTGILAMQGGYLFFMDADDFLDRDCLEDLMYAVQTYDVRLACGIIRKMTEEGKSLSTVDQCSGDISILEGRRKLDFIIEHVSASPKLFHKDIFETFRFEENFTMEDFELIPMLAFHESKIAVIDKLMYTYVIHDHGIMGNNKVYTSPNLIYAIENALTYLQNVDEKKEEAEILMEAYLDHGINRMKRVAVTTGCREQADFVRAFRRIYGRNMLRVMKSDLKLKDKLSVALLLFSPTLFEQVARRAVG